jgi:hypothetical protein
MLTSYGRLSEILVNACTETLASVYRSIIVPPGVNPLALHIFSICYLLLLLLWEFERSAPQTSLLFVMI